MLKYEKGCDFMLEFIKTCSVNNLYERAQDIENSLTRFNCVSSMNSYVEIMFKELIVDFDSNLKSKVNNIKLHQIIKYPGFGNFIHMKLHFLELHEIDTLIRPEGNKGKHSKNYSRLSFENIEKYFKIIFNLSVSYFKYKSNGDQIQEYKDYLVWNDKKFKDLYDFNRNNDADKKTLEELNKSLEEKECLINELYESLKVKNEELVKKEKEYNEKILNYVGKDTLKKREKEIRLLTEEKNKLIESKNKSNRELQLTKNEVIKLTAEIDLLKNKIDIDSDYEEKYKVLLIDLEEKSLRCSELEKKEEELTIQLYEKKFDIDLIRAEIEESFNKEIVELKKERDAIKREYGELKEKIYNTDINIKQDKKISNEKQINKLNNDLENLNKKLQDIVKRINQNAPNCDVCNKKMVMTSKEKDKGSIFYKCEDYDRIAHKSKTKNINTDLKQQYIDTLNKIDNFKDKFNLMNSIISENNEICYVSLGKSESNQNFIFNSMQVPKQVFKEEYLKFLYKKTYFRVDTNLSTKDVERSKRNIYSLVLRLLNRGKIIFAQSYENQILYDKFNDEEYMSYFTGEKSSVFPCSKKYFRAVQMHHMLSIGIVKALELGMISEKCNFDITSVDTLFDEEELEYILNIAKNSVTEVVSYMAELYNIDLKLELNNDTEKQFSFVFGRGNCDKYIKISGFESEYEYLNSMLPIDHTFTPSDVNEKTLLYFINYLFNYPDFREGQFEAIKRLLLRKDTLVLLPTGAGKSIIYQLASFLMPGLTIVISPLTSLIDDQISNLKSKFGITTAVGIHSDNDKLYNDNVLKVIRNNNSPLLYISPERLSMTNFQTNIREFLQNNNVNIIAVDEVHCVSEWGHEFRPSYLKIGQTARKLFNKEGCTPAIIGLTGTASLAVLKDIKRDLNIIEDEAILTPNNFDRLELNYYVEKVDTIDKGITLNNIIKEKIPKYFGKDYHDFYELKNEETNSGIVFTQFTSANEEYGALGIKNNLKFKNLNLKIEPFFSKIPEEYEHNKEKWIEIKNNNALEFKNNNINILVATKAYGMGIDKPNIRFIVHKGIPSSIEQYYQEAGRAGRDRKKSYCVLLYTSYDENKNINDLMDPSGFKNYSLISLPREQRDDCANFKYFHSGSFPGVEEELSYIKIILKCIKKEKIINLQLNIDELNHCYSIEYNLLSEDSEKKWQKACIRLNTLGIISEYTYDYATKTISFTKYEYDKESIANKYSEYIALGSPGKESSEKQKILNIVSKDLEIKSSKILIEYIYENIESARRNAFMNILEMVIAANGKNDVEQNALIRKKITSYFDSSSETQNLISSITNDLDKGFNAISNKFNLNNPDYLYTSQDLDEYVTLEYSIRRRLENAYDSNHPGLLYASAIIRIINNGDLETACKEINFATKSAIINYQIGKEDNNLMLIKIMNLIINKSYESFEKSIKLIFNSADKVKLYEKFINTSFISKKHKDYLMLKYLNEKM